MNRYLKIALFLVAGVLISYLGWLSHVKERKGSDNLNSRIGLYWEAVRLNNIYDRYHMETPVQLGQVDPSDYKIKRDFNTRVISYKIHDVKIDGDQAVVDVDQEIAFPDSGTSTFAMKSKDYWTFVNNNWYHGKSMSDSGTKPRQ